MALDLSDGKIFTTMEWLMVFLYHCSRWFFNVFFTCEPLLPMVFQWFFRFQPLVSMVFQWFFPIQPLPLNEWFCGSPLTSMVFQWFWEKLKVVHKKGQKTKKNMICSTNT